jgi:polyferredoxin
MIILRAEAKHQGLTRYFTGKPCKHGHIAFRETASGGCCECQNAYKRKMYHTQTKRHQNEQSKAWKAANKERVKQYNKLYREKNPEYYGTWKRQNKGLVNASTYKRRTAKIYRTPKWLIEDDFWVMKEAYELAALRTKLFGFGWHVDHIVPLQGEIVSGLHVPNNLQVIPARENESKGNTFK